MENYEKNIVDPKYVYEKLDSENFKVIDCTVYFELKKVGASTIHSGYEDYLKRHIPGSAYLHMVDDLSEEDNPIPFSIISQGKLNEKLCSIGINNGDEIILYGSGFHMAITRAWWVLTMSGANNVKIMNGGLDGWQEQNFPLSSGEEVFKKGNFRGSRSHETIFDKNRMKEALENDDFIFVNALTQRQFCGEGTHYGRPGRIPKSINIPALNLLNHNTGKFLPPSEMRDMMQPLIDTDKSIVSYCGGGIAATTVFFAAKIFNIQKLFLYDNSLLEWSNDLTCPMELEKE